MKKPKHPIVQMIIEDESLHEPFKLDAAHWNEMVAVVMQSYRYSEWEIRRAIAPLILEPREITDAPAGLDARPQGSR